MDKEITDLLDEIHADVQRYEQQQHQQQEPEDVDLDELMFEILEDTRRTIYHMWHVSSSSTLLKSTLNDSFL